MEIDSGIERRLRILPFNKIFVPADKEAEYRKLPSFGGVQNPLLKDKFSNDERYRNEFVRMLIDRFESHVRDQSSLPITKSSKMITEGYIKSMKTVQEFIEENYTKTVPLPRNFVENNELVSRYQDKTGDSTMNAKKMKKEMLKMGFEYIRNGSGKYGYKGLVQKSSYAEEEAEDY
jgi:phage/plasmid-associated DNA primase